MPTIALNNPDPDVLDGRHIRAAAFLGAQSMLLDVLHDRLSAADPQSPQALTVGAGYSRLPQLIADAGYHVTALDASAQAVDVAQAASASSWPQISHGVSDPSRLTAPPRSYDLVWCIDTLETHPDPRAVLAEVARVTRPTGLVVLDTVSNSILSRLIYLRLFQQLPGTRIMPPDRYRREHLISPIKLRDLARQATLRIEDVYGYEPASPRALIGALLRRRRGVLADGELADAAGFRLSTAGHSPPVTYYAVARPEAD